MLYVNNSLGVICFKKPQQVGVPKDMSEYEPPFVAGAWKQYLMQLVVVCDLLSAVECLAPHPLEGIQSSVEVNKI